MGVIEHDDSQDNSNHDDSDDPNVEVLLPRQCVDGGLFSDPRSASTAHRALFIASLALFLLLLRTGIQLAGPENRAVLNGDISGNEHLTEYETHQFKDATIGGVIISSLFVTCCVAGMITCLCWGLKHMERDWIYMFACCNACCVAFGVFQLAAFFISLNSGPVSCEEAANAGYNPLSCYLSIVVEFILVPLFCLNTIWGFILYSRSSRILSASSPYQPNLYHHQHSQQTFHSFQSSDSFQYLLPENNGISNSNENNNTAGIVVSLTGGNPVIYSDTRHSHATFDYNNEMVSNSSTQGNPGKLDNGVDVIKPESSTTGITIV